MFRLLRTLLFQLAVQAVCLLFALLIFLQALLIGVNYGLIACLLLSGGGMLAFFALLAIHELGHMFMGLAMGLPLLRFTVGPLQLVRDEGRIRARLNTAWFQHAAYVMHELPPEGVRRWRWAAVILSGPGSNLLLGAACLTIASCINPGPTADLPLGARVAWRSVALLYPGDAVTAWFNIAGLLSLGLGLLCLIPGSAAGLRSDGGQLLDLWRGREAPSDLGRLTRENCESVMDAKENMKKA